MFVSFCVEKCGGEGLGCVFDFLLVLKRVRV